MRKIDDWLDRVILQEKSKTTEQYYKKRKLKEMLMDKVDVIIRAKRFSRRITAIKKIKHRTDPCRPYRDKKLFLEKKIKNTLMYFKESVTLFLIDQEKFHQKTMMSK